MKVLVIGGGGREHALAWALAKSPRVTRVLVAPGNGGIRSEPKCEAIAVSKIAGEGANAAYARIAEAEGVDLTVVGPEQPLVDGIVDLFRARGLTIFGPTAGAARLEGSKAFAKDFMARHRIPTAAGVSVSTLGQAQAALASMRGPIVVKADGLAAGKGVSIVESASAALAEAGHLLSGERFGHAGHVVVLEEFIRGEELSFICLVDGSTVVPLATSQDHKARDDGDLGPNTGGMGAISPAPGVSSQLIERVLDEVIQPTVSGLLAEGMPYQGFLYAGLMITPEGAPKVLEFNCRLGDPEAQPLLMRLDSDLAELLLAGAQGRLAGAEPIRWRPEVAVGVVLAARGYPEAPERGVAVRGVAVEGDPDRNNGRLKVFHAGTEWQGAELVSCGGRVLCVTGIGDDAAQARERVYGRLARIELAGGFYRSDIGARRTKAS